MPCSASGPCNCTAGCPVPQGVSNTLGFNGVKACCRVACPALPLHKVVICIALNDTTSVKIQQGCRPDHFVEEDEDCAIDWTWGQTYSSDGRKCAVVNWNRTVTDKSFVRLKFCRESECDAPCEAAYNSCGRKIVNALLKFQVDTVDHVAGLQAVARYDRGHGLGCYRVVCGGECCDTDVQEYVHLSDIRAGTEIVYGPIGTTVPLPALV